MASQRKKYDKSLLSAVREIVDGNEPVAYYIVWKYAPQLMPDGDSCSTFEELSKRYDCISKRPEKSIIKSLYNENAQRAIKYLMERIDVQRSVDILNRYYQMAMDGDTQALKAYMEFKKKFFDETDNSNELEQILHGMSFDTDKNEEELDFSYKM